MPSTQWTRVVVFLAAAVWFVAALAMGVNVDQAWIKSLGITTSVVVLLLVLFDSFLWRFVPARLMKVPKLAGTWKATLRSSFEDEVGNPTELTCFLAIRQTYSSIHIEMLFPKSESYSTSASIVWPDGVSELWYSYRSHAHSLARAGNPPHMGAAKMRVATGGEISLSGDYWTDRGSFGRIETSAHTTKFMNDYKSAVMALAE